MERSAFNLVTRRVKVADLEGNMDLRGLKTVTEMDRERLARWHRVRAAGCRPGQGGGTARKHLPGYEKKVRPLRDALEEGISTTVPDTELNGHKVQRLANTTNITFRGIESEALLLLLDQEGACASSGSACLADPDEPSHVVKAMKPDGTSSRQRIR